MGPYIIRRLLYMIVVLLFVVAITFFIFFILPTADPAALRAGRSPTPETLKAIREQLGLDKPVPEQFWVYLKGLVLHFDFGNSFVNNTNVRTLIFDRLPNTLFLISGAAILWFTGGVLIGTISAVKRGTVLDRAAMDKASPLQGDARLKAWAEIDKMITGDAPAVPFDWDKTTIIWSKDVNGVAADYYNAVDFTQSSLK